MDQRLWAPRLERLLRPFYREGAPWATDAEAFRHSDAKVRAHAVKSLADKIPRRLHREAFHLFGNLLFEDDNPEVRREAVRSLPDLMDRHEQPFDPTVRLYLSALDRESHEEVKDAMVSHLIGAALEEKIEDMDLMDRVLERVCQEAGRKKTDLEKSGVAEFRRRKSFQALVKLAENGKLWIRPQALKQIRAIADGRGTDSRISDRAVGYLFETARRQLRLHGKADPAIMDTLNRASRNIKGPMAVHHPLVVFLGRYARRVGPTLRKREPVLRS